jgi:hypothetical protein
MIVRVIIEEDNKTHPYEFASYAEAVNFLQEKFIKKIKKDKLQGDEEKPAKESKSKKKAE